MVAPKKQVIPPAKPIARADIGPTKPAAGVMTTRRTPPLFFSSRPPRAQSDRLALVDLQYADLRRDKGLYNRLVARGAMQTLLGADDAEKAMTEPPSDTRAYFRGECLRRYPDAVAAASWDSVIFDVGRGSLVRVPTLEPLRGTRAHVEGLLNRCATGADLVAELVGNR